MKKWFVAVFMLFVPAVASAWTFGVNVTNTTAGIAAGNKATVTIGSTSTVVTVGTKYFYPANTVSSLSVDVANLQNVLSITLDNVALPIASPLVVTKGSASSHTLSVVYSANTVQKRDIALAQSTGGLTSLKIGSSITTVGFTSVPVGTAVDVVAQPNSGYRLVKFTINGQDDFTGTGSTSPVTKTFAVDGALTPNTVSALYEVVPKITAMLSLPLSATVGALVTAVATADSNVTPLVYSFTTDCSAERQEGASNTFPFTPVAVGTCSVSVTVTHVATQTSSAPVTGTVSVISGSGESNWECTNCHAGSTPQIVDDYNRSAHNGNPGSTCSSCHTAVPHSSNINARTVSATTFKVMTSHVISGFNKGDTFCSKCHSPTIVTDFAAGPHLAPAGANSCSFCHGIHYVNASCVNCHIPGNPYGLPWPPPGFTFHNAYTGIDVCRNCHNTHNPGVVTGMSYPHFSSYTTAQYVTTNISCDKCHSSAADSALHIYSANRQWARSGKANPTSPSYTTYDFKTRGTPGPATPATTTGDDCVRCHTTTGYVNYVGTGFTNIAPWGISGTLPGGDRTREMIACNACHKAPFTADFARRRVGINTNPFNPRDPARHVVVWYGYSSAASQKIISAKVFDDKGESNVCIACHSGRNVGENIKYVAETVGNTGSFWRNVDFISPHYMGAAGILFQVGNSLQTGYEFRSADAYTPLGNFAHPGIGDGVQGPCVGCHMNGSVKKHLFTPISSASNGAIAAITSTTCGGCHGATGPLKLDTTILQASKDGYEAGMSIIASLLKNRGIYYSATTYPYFFTTGVTAQQTFVNRTVNWDAGAPTFNGADVMGAAFNLKLLQADAGCWTHNSAYTKRLLYDTIDFLDDGNPNNGTVGAAIQNATVSQDVKDKATAYIGVRP